MNRVVLGENVLRENDRLAAELRERFEREGIFCLNLISSPGSGKTTLLEKTLERLPRETRVAVLTGDIQTDNDARRLARFGFPVRQITTGGACHLDARMIQNALAAWPPEPFDLLLIENVGNLVCPASYDLGEHAKIVMLSLTEGDDKPLKYPAIFSRSKLLILSKTDLHPYLDFRVEAAIANARRVQPEIEIIEVSCRADEGLEAWMRWLECCRDRCMASPAQSHPVLPGQNHPNR
jgi:hydrogenase nickel incorporation protein HypB